ncbi:hypothetical protein VP1G_03183 [Cytospora mali]|uniref:SnoaL-like domain-containing protein n=1 Tax=Cytospora mali TaxID=578113 RepID=A0A194UVV5_CYTMA|nr:hypothetical protein VP1G_03183 [Valsa mali var. pyri (nom. inval.)]
MSSLPSLPPKLSPPLNDREAINDAIYRAVVGLDTNDVNLFDSAFTEEGSFDLNGKVMEGREAIHSQCFDFISKLDTTHFITNTRININEGGSTASATASALAQHYRGGQGADPAASRFLSGVLYWMDLVKDEKDGLWKVECWRLRSVWGEGDSGVMTGN